MTSLSERYQCDETFRTIVDTVSRGAYVKDGVWHGGPSIADGEMAASILDCFEVIPDGDTPLYRLRREPL